MTDNRRPLMGTDNIFGLQDNGYKSTVSALAEIIDNSIQASAKNIDLIITIKGKIDHEKTHLTVLVSGGVLNKTSNDIKITAEIDKQRVPRPNRSPSLPTLNEYAPVGTDESINGLLV